VVSFEFTFGALGYQSQHFTAAYSLASLFEWLLVAFNVMYHTMGMLEWKNVYFLVQEKQHQEIYLKQV